MGKRTNQIKMLNKRRKRGLKNPVVLWLWSLAVTFVLTILPSVFISDKGSAELANAGFWIKSVMDSLYPMMLAQSAVTLVQNFAVIQPSEEEQAAGRPGMRFDWTAALGAGAFIYTLAFPLIVRAAPPHQNTILLTLSAFLMLLGALSARQVDRELDKVLKIQKALELQRANRSVTGTTHSPDASDPSAGGGEAPLQDDTPVLK